MLGRRARGDDKTICASRSTAPCVPPPCVAPRTIVSPLDDYGPLNPLWGSTKRGCSHMHALRRPPLRHPRRRSSGGSTSGAAGTRPPRTLFCSLSAPRSSTSTAARSSSSSPSSTTWHGQGTCPPLPVQWPPKGRRPSSASPPGPPWYPASLPCSPGRPRRVWTGGPHPFGRAHRSAPSIMCENCGRGGPTM